MKDDGYLSIIAGVAIPALQAAITALFSGLAVLGVAAVAKHAGIIQAPPWALAVVVWSLSGVLTWWALLRDWRVELYGVRDSDSQESGLPYIPPDPVRVELASNGGRSVQFLDLPVTLEQLRLLGEGITDGMSFTESVWVGSDRIFSRGEFVALRDVLIRRGCLEWRSPRDHARGVDLTRGGQALMRHFASMVETPTLPAGERVFSARFQGE